MFTLVRKKRQVKGYFLCMCIRWAQTKAWKEVIRSFYCFWSGQNIARQATPTTSGVAPLHTHKKESTKRAERLSVISAVLPLWFYKYTRVWHKLCSQDYSRLTGNYNECQHVKYVKCFLKYYNDEGEKFPEPVTVQIKSCKNNKSSASGSFSAWSWAVADLQSKSCHGGGFPSSAFIKPAEEETQKVQKPPESL